MFFVFFSNAVSCFKNDFHWFCPYFNVCVCVCNIHTYNMCVCVCVLHI